MKVMNAAALVLVVVSAAAEGCREELISFSACLAYVSYPPNNLTESASEKCCKAFSSAVESSCLCYVIRDPLFLGFPLNTTRLLSLSSLCPSPFSTSFPFLCSSGTSFFLLSSSSFLSSLSHLLLVLLLSQILLLYPLSPHHQLKPSELLLVSLSSSYIYLNKKQIKNHFVINTNACMCRRRRRRKVRVRR